MLRIVSRSYLILITTSICPPRGDKRCANTGETSRLSTNDHRSHFCESRFRNVSLWAKAHRAVVFVATLFSNKTFRFVSLCLFAVLRGSRKKPNEWTMVVTNVHCTTKTCCERDRLKTCLFRTTFYSFMHKKKRHMELRKRKIYEDIRFMEKLLQTA